MKTILILFIFVLCSCAGSKFAVKQDEYWNRYNSGQRQVILKQNQSGLRGYNMKWQKPKR